MAPLGWPTVFSRGRVGLWRFLIARDAGRTSLRLEQERNAATAAVLSLLPPGGELLESEPGGRTRLIRKSSVPGVVAQPQYRDSDQVGRLPR